MNWNTGYSNTHGRIISAFFPQQLILSVAKRAHSYTKNFPDLKLILIVLSLSTVRPSFTAAQIKRI